MQEVNTVTMASLMFGVVCVWGGGGTVRRVQLDGNASTPAAAAATTGCRGLGVQLSSTDPHLATLHCVLSHFCCAIQHG